jgi:flagellar L-ring protein FlgH
MHRVIAACAVVGISTSCMGQSLLRQEPARVKDLDAPPQDVQAPLRGVSLTLVEAPKPRDYKTHDLVSIIISEQSSASSKAQLDTKKDSKIDAGVDKLPDLMELLQLRLDDSDRSSLTSVKADAKANWKGDGKYERSERLTDRITATILDIKPNGTIVLEARRLIQKDKETQTVVLSGTCRREDITNANTILSSQLAELVVKIESEGEVRQASEKGWLTNLFETIFNF